MNVTLGPIQLQPLVFGTRINIYINNGGSLFRMTSANLTMNYSISRRKRQKQKKDTNEQSRNGERDDLFGANTILNDNRRDQFDGAEEGEKDKISEFFSKLPWDMTLPIL
jgi:hypothetical protein